MAVQRVRVAQLGGTGAGRTISVSISTAGVDTVIVFAAAINSLGDSEIDTVTWDPSGTPLSFTRVGDGGILSMWVLTGMPIAVKSVQVGYSGSGDIAAIAAITSFVGATASGTVTGTQTLGPTSTTTPSVTLTSVQRNEVVMAGLCTSQPSGSAPVITSVTGEQYWSPTVGPNADGFVLKLAGGHVDGINNASRDASWTLGGLRTCHVIGGRIVPAAFYRASAPDHIGSPDHIYDASRFHASTPDYIADPN